MRRSLIWNCYARSVVVAVRGTTSMEDLITDCVADPEELPPHWLPHTLLQDDNTWRAKPETEGPGTPTAIGRPSEGEEGIEQECAANKMHAAEKGTSQAQQQPKRQAMYAHSGIRAASDKIMEVLRARHSSAKCVPSFVASGMYLRKLTERIVMLCLPGSGDC